MLCGEIVFVTIEYGMKDSRTQPDSSGLTAFSGCLESLSGSQRTLICTIYQEYELWGWKCSIAYRVHKVLGSDSNTE